MEEGIVDSFFIICFCNISRLFFYKITRLSHSVTRFNNLKETDIIFSISKAITSLDDQLCNFINCKRALPLEIPQGRISNCLGAVLKISYFL